MEKETLEEAAESWVYNKPESNYHAFIAGANWQAERISLMEIELNHTKTLLESCEKALEDRDKKAERMYSDYDILKAFRQGQLNMEYSDIFGFESTLSEEVWFERFKKIKKK